MKIPILFLWNAVLTFALIVGLIVGFVTLESHDEAIREQAAQTVEHRRLLIQYAESISENAKLSESNDVLMYENIMIAEERLNQQAEIIKQITEIMQGR